MVRAKNLDLKFEFDRGGGDLSNINPHGVLGDDKNEPQQKASFVLLIQEAAMNTSCGCAAVVHVPNSHYSSSTPTATWTLFKEFMDSIDENGRY